MITVKKTFPLILILLLILIFIFLITKKTETIAKMDFYNVKSLEDLYELFPKTAQQIKNFSELSQKLAKEQLEKIISIPNEERTFENTVKALDKISLLSHPLHVAIYAIKFVSPNKNLQEVADQELLKINNFFVDNIFGNRKLYEAFKYYVENKSGNENLNAEQKYFIEETLKNFKKEGLELPQEKFELIKKLMKELAELELKFATNIAQSNCKLTIKKNELEGLKDEFINSLNKDKNGDYVLGCDYPTYFAIMDQCNVESTRRKMYLLYANKGYPENIEILNQIIKKRDEKAKLLGFKSYADLIIDNEMAKSINNVESFLNNLTQKAQKKAFEEITLFTKELPESVSLQDRKIKPWDTRYIKESYRKKHLNLDDSKISEYFPMQNTIDQLLNIYEIFFGLKFEKIEVDKLWDKDVQLIKAFSDSGKFLGYLLLDLYPREGKFNHACNITIVHPYYNNGDYYPAVSLIIANFPKPTNNQPSLLKYQDVVTFFHEFGHAIHGMLSPTEMISVSGTNVKKDFVEMPSQMLENWLKDKEILKKVSQHYKTKEKLPDDIIKNIIALDQFDSGDRTLRQIFLSLISLKYFEDGENKDTQAISKEIYNKVIKHSLWQDDAHTQASFNHLTGYGPTYYGYLWSDVFAKDLFSEIKKYGLLNPEIGQKYVSKVLAPGGSKDPNILLKNFLGRDPNQNAYFESLGFK